MSARRTIPEIRDRLHAVAREIEPRFPGYAGELHRLAEETRREYHGRRARNYAPPITADLAARVRQYAQANPRAPMDLIGRRFGVNIGRVSEILFGRRGER